MPQSDQYTICILCGQKLNDRCCLHSDGIHIRSEIEDELVVVHKSCASLVLKAHEKRDWVFFALMKDR